MSVGSESSSQKIDSDDSIVACQQDAADFFDSIGPFLPCQISGHDGSYQGISCRIPSVGKVWGRRLIGVGRRPHERVESTSCRRPKTCTGRDIAPPFRGPPNCILGRIAAGGHVSCSFLALVPEPRAGGAYRGPRPQRLVAETRTTHELTTHASSS